MCAISYQIYGSDGKKQNGELERTAGEGKEAGLGQNISYA